MNSYLRAVTVTVLLAVASIDTSGQVTLLLESGEEVQLTQIDRKKFFNQGKVIPLNDLRAFDESEVKQASVDSVIYVRKEFQGSTVFLEPIVNGQVSFYQRPKKGFNEAYFVERDQNLEKLTTSKTTTSGTSGGQSYKTTLRVFFRDCSTLTSDEINEIGLNYRSIKEAVVKYNESCGHIDYVKTEPEKFDIDEFLDPLFIKDDHTKALVDAVIYPTDGEPDSVQVHEELFFKEKKLIIQGSNSIVGNENLASVEINSVRYYFKTDVKGKELFLERLAEGNVNLYTTRDDLEKFYYAEKNEEVRELRIEKRYRTRFSETRYNVIEEFKAVLRIYMSDCPSFDGKYIEKTQLNPISLRKTVERYNSTCHPDW